MAVAIWNHKPSADELLARRLHRGWAPRTSSTTRGHVVMGHAACLLGQGMQAVADLAQHAKTQGAPESK